MKKEEIVCPNCRFKFESDDYEGVRCAKNAPIGYAEDNNETYKGVIVSRQFYCGEGEWIEYEDGVTNDWTKCKVYHLGDIT